MIATVENMRKCETAGIRAAVLDMETGEFYSANPRDYFWLADDEPLTDIDGEPQIIVRCIPATFEEIEELAS